MTFPCRPATRQTRHIRATRPRLHRAFGALAFSACLIAGSSAAQAANVVTQVIDFGHLPTAFSTFYGHSFTSSARLQASDVFHDDYAFTLGASTFNSLTAIFSFAEVFEVENLSVRLFRLTSQMGTTTPTTSAISLLDSDALARRAANTVAVSSRAATHQVVAPIDLAAGTYVLEVSGNVTGTVGGSYGGVMNVIPLPEPSGATLALAGLGALGVLGLLRGVAARRKH